MDIINKLLIESSYILKINPTCFSCSSSCCSPENHCRCSDIFVRALLISLQATIGIDFLSKTMYLEDRTVSKILLLFSVSSRNEDQHLVLCSPHLWDHSEAQAEPSSPSCFQTSAVETREWGVGNHHWICVCRGAGAVWEWHKGLWSLPLGRKRWCTNLRGEWWWESGERGAMLNPFQLLMPQDRKVKYNYWMWPVDSWLHLLSTPCLKSRWPLSSQMRLISLLGAVLAHQVKSLLCASKAVV